MPTAKIAAAAKLTKKSVQNHRTKHLPYRPQNFRKAETVGDQLEDLRFEAQRLQALGECGINVSHAVTALRERRQILELEARMGGNLDATHKRLLNNSKDAAGDVEIVFTNGRPRAVERPA
jgi:hypothetical protein